MTIKEYISQKLRAFEITEADFCDIALNGLDPEAEYDETNAKQTGVSIVGIIEELVLAPSRKQINENGFSMSWDYGNLSKYYLWLCRKWNVTPDNEVATLIGASMITDKTDMW